MTYARIVGTGSHLPEAVVTNTELSKRVETSDEWIQQRVGIQSRHICSPDETLLFMATQAAQRALDMAQVTAEEIDLIIVATSTADDIMPSTATSLQYAIGAKPCISFDISAACTGFVCALHIANQFFKTGVAKRALVLGGERMSRITDWMDRSTCVLFGDGVGAAVLAADDHTGILSSYVASNGKDRDLLFVPNSLPVAPFESEVPPAHLRMDGRAVFRQAVNMLGDLVARVLREHDLPKSSIDWLIPHQANRRIIEATAKKMALPWEKVVLTLPEQGNTSAASVALALDIAVRDGRVQKDQLVLLEAFGAGFVWGAVLLKF